MPQCPSRSWFGSGLRRTRAFRPQRTVVLDADLVRNVDAIVKFIERHLLAMNFSQGFGLQLIPVGNSS